MARFWRGCGCAAVLGVLAIVPAARAQGPGIQVDPGSPSGTEYQLPLERARQDAQPGGPPRQVRPGERTAPAFGEGITTPPSSATAPQNEGQGSTGATPRRGARKPASRSGPTHTSTAATPAAAAAPPPPRAKAADGPGTSLLGVGAMAAGAIALGAGVGLLLRRRVATRPGRSPK